MRSKTGTVRRIKSRFRDVGRRSRPRAATKALAHSHRLAARSARPPPPPPRPRSFSEFDAFGACSAGAYLASSLKPGTSMRTLRLLAVVIKVAQHRDADQQQQDDEVLGVAHFGLASRAALLCLYRTSAIASEAEQARLGCG